MASGLDILPDLTPPPYGIHITYDAQKGQFILEPFLVVGENQHPLTFASLYNRVNDTAKKLCSSLAKKGSKAVLSSDEFLSVIHFLHSIPCFVDGKPLTFRSSVPLHGVLSLTSDSVSFRIVPSEKSHFVILVKNPDIWIFDFQSFCYVRNTTSLSHHAIVQLFEGMTLKKERMEELLSFIEYIRTSFSLQRIDGLDGSPIAMPTILLLCDAVEGNLRVRVRAAYGDPPTYVLLNPSRQFVAANGMYWKRNIEKERHAMDILAALAGITTSEKLFSPREALDFLDVIVPQLEQAGISLVGLHHLHEFKRSRASVRWAVSSSADWFSVSFAGNVNGTHLSLEEISQLAQSNDQYTWLERFGWVSIDIATRMRLRAFFEHGVQQGTSLAIPRTRFAALEPALFDMPLTDKNPSRAFIRTKYAGRVKAPVGFKGVLRPHQEEGLAWLLFLHEQGFGGILADDMGLGKTVQVLAFLLTLRERPSLIVVPSSVLAQWEEEIRKFTPFHVVVLTSRSFEKDTLLDADIVLTTYTVLRNAVETLSSIPFAYAIFDEAQCIKNHTSQGAKAASRIQAQGKLVVTGTPIENSLSDLYTHCMITNPTLLGSFDTFKKTFLLPIRNNDQRARDTLRTLVSPFILRRTKADVAQSLAPKIVRTVACDLFPRQRALYDTVFLNYRTLLAERLTKEGFSHTQTMFFEALLRLRQICLHPRLAGVPGSDIDESVKLLRCLDIVKEITTRGEKVLVFSQFTSFFPYLQHSLEEEGIPFCVLEGSTQNRDAVVRQFKESASVFLISLKAGGFGLNLTEANHVILLDPWWNPAVEMQAMDRAHRLGQAKQVFVYRFVAPATIEERIVALQQEKHTLAQSIVGEGVFHEEDARFVFDL